MTLLLAGLVVLAGVALVALVGQRGDNSTWVRWSYVGEAFGVINSVLSAVAVVALVITWALQSRELRAQRAELAAQRSLLEGAQTALHRSTDIDVRKLHVTLIRMAVENPHLADVWPSNVSAGPQAKSQHMYCNLLLQHVWLQYQIEMATREETISNLRYLFASPKMRAFWKDTASNRNSIYSDDTRDSGLAAEADRIWHEYEEVLACDRQTGDLPTAEAHMEAASLP